MAITNTANINEIRPFETNTEANTLAPITFDTQNLDVIKILLADENPDNPSKTKDSFKQLQCPIQTHRVTEIVDLTESLKSNDWDLIIAYSSSNIFLPEVIRTQIEETETTISTIYLDDNYTAEKALQIMQFGIHDYLSSDEPSRILLSILRETRAIRDHKKTLVADSSLAEANATNKLLLESTTDAIAYMTDGVVIHANHAFVSALGFESADDIEWQPFIDLVAANNQNAMRSILKNLSTAEPEQHSAETELLNAKQETLTTTLAFAPANYDGEACTQIILCSDEKSLADDEASLTRIEPAVTKAPVNPEPRVEYEPEASASSQNVNLANALKHIDKIEGKGIVFFAALDNIASIKKSMGLAKYALWLDHLSNSINDIIKDQAILLDRIGESWICAATNDIDIKNMAESLCDMVNANLQENSRQPNCQFSLGASKFGIAELTPTKALHKAFTACASQQLKGGGYKIISPQIDNAEASDAISSALELGRLRIKYQPIVGLHNQSTHLYDVSPYIENDAGREQPAAALIDQLGIEKKNILLDQWLITAALKDLEQQSSEKEQLCVLLPLTTSSIINDDFIDWLSSLSESQNIPTHKLCFSLAAEQISSYEEKSQLLCSSLSKLGFYTAISIGEYDHIEMIGAYKPKFIQLSSNLTKQASDVAKNNTQESLKQILNLARETAGSCISCDVDSATELAQLWQTGVPYVQGSYLQGPMPTMSYEFSDIG